MTIYLKPGENPLKTIMLSNMKVKWVVTKQIYEKYSFPIYLNYPEKNATESKT